MVYGATKRHLDFLYKLESLVNYLNTTYTQDQLVTALGIPLANIQALVSFYQAALPAAAQLHANQSLIQGV